MGQFSLLTPERGSTVRGNIAREFSVQTLPSDEIRAFLPASRSNKRRESSDALRSMGEDDNTTSNEIATLQPAPLIRLNNSSALIPRRIKILQQWEGVVSELGKIEFTAELRNLTVTDRTPEFAEFPFAEVSESDRALVQPGAVFYWAIGYDTTPGGQIRRVSEIRLRRSPEWTPRKLQAISVEADEWYRQLVEEDGQKASPKS